MSTRVTNDIIADTVFAGVVTAGKVNSNSQTVGSITSNTATLKTLSADSATITNLNSTNPTLGTVNASSVHATGNISADENVLVTGGVTSSSLNVSGDATFGGHIVGGLPLTVGQTNLTYYSSQHVTRNQVFNNAGTLMPGNATANFYFTRIGNVVTMCFNWDAGISLPISGNWLVFPGVIPVDYASNLLQINVPVYFYFGGGGDRFVMQISGNSISLANKTGNPLGAFSANGVFNVFGASATWLVA